ncbi:MAG: CcmD family protein [Pirellulaceae bacterium]
MDTVVIAYLVVWLAVVVYVARLGVQQRSLLRIVNALVVQGDPSQDVKDSSSVLPS